MELPQNANDLHLIGMSGNDNSRIKIKQTVSGVLVNVPFGQARILGAGFFYLLRFYCYFVVLNVPGAAVPSSRIIRGPPTYNFLLFTLF